MATQEGAVPERGWKWNDVLGQEVPAGSLSPDFSLCLIWGTKRGATCAPYSNLSRQFSFA